MKLFIPNVPNGYTAHRHLDHKAAYGPAILIKKWIPVQGINIHSFYNVIGLEIQLGLKKYRIYSIYCRPPLVSIRISSSNI